MSNEEQYTVLVPAKVKRALKEEFRRVGKRQLFYYRTFMAAVVLLLKYARVENLSAVIVDVEYYGHDKILRSMFLEMWSRYFDTMPEIYFTRIGKKSGAHQVSYATMKGKRKPDKAIGFDEIYRLALK